MSPCTRTRLETISRYLAKARAQSDWLPETNSSYRAIWLVLTILLCRCLICSQNPRIPCGIRCGRESYLTWAAAVPKHCVSGIVSSLKYLECHDTGIVLIVQFGNIISNFSPIRTLTNGSTVHVGQLHSEGIQKEWHREFYISESGSQER